MGSKTANVKRIITTSALILLCISTGFSNDSFISVPNVISLKNSQFIGKRITLKAWFHGAMKNMYGNRLLDSIQITDSSCVDNMGGFTAFWAIYGSSLARKVNTLKKSHQNINNGRLTIRVKGTLKRIHDTLVIDLADIEQCD